MKCSTKALETDRRRGMGTNRENDEPWQHFGY
jgi:hypothetical protein